MRNYRICIRNATIIINVDKVKYKLLLLWVMTPLIDPIFTLICYFNYSDTLLMIISGARLAEAPIDILHAGMSKAIAPCLNHETLKFNFRFVPNKSRSSLVKTLENIPTRIEFNRVLSIKYSKLRLILLTKTVFFFSKCPRRANKLHLFQGSFLGIVPEFK